MNDQAQIAADVFCRGLYPEVKSFFDDIGVVPRLGFKILNGPPIKNAPYLFIGYQPGGREEDHKKEIKKGTDKCWPPVCEYATEEWRLAPRMQEVFGRDLLTQCVGTNAIFLRYPNATEYIRDVGSKRKCIESFCMNKICEIVDAITPQRIVTIGLATLQMFGPTEPELKNGSRVLTKVGKIAGRNAVGMIHLTGARLSKYDLTLISNRFK